MVKSPTEEEAPKIPEMQEVKSQKGKNVQRPIKGIFPGGCHRLC